ncbi:MAG: hypothetical protein IH933_11685 [Euryarchaeota archaeon]|nr:hypothetical protein [Euryarchaeota archaeon]
MDDGVDESDELNDDRRRLLRASGSLAAGLSVLGVSGVASAGGPVASEGDELPYDGERIGEAHPACAEDSPPEPNASNPHERYRQLLAQALDMRDNNQSNLDHGGIRSVLRERNGEFDGELVFFVGNDFGEPRVFLSEAIGDQQAALEAVLDRIHEQKWRADHAGLRSVRNQVLDEVQSVHQGLPAVYHGNGSADYDIDFPWNRTYNFVTIRQAVGLVDWMTNAQDPWLDGLRLTF